MAKSFSKKRPTFTQFRELFLDVLKNNYGKDVDPFSPWKQIGNDKQRALILASVRDKLIEKFGLGENLEIRRQLINLEGSVESVISQLFHSFSTLTLVEHINETVLEQQRARREQEKQ